MARLLLALIITTTALTCTAAEAWRDALPQARQIGEGEYRWFGLRIYYAQLWASQRPVTPDMPLALRVTYTREISNQRLVDTSIEEIRRINGQNVPKETLERWRVALARVLPDIRTGDSLTGVYLPAQGARFYANDRLTGEIDDLALARAFFAIWLDPATRAPALRRHLLGLS